jgi:hypothetical protein
LLIVIKLINTILAYDVAVKITLTHGIRNQTTIYNLVTKELHYEKPTMDSLREALERMRDDMVLNGIDLVTMPRLGCGLDGLEWEAVKQLLHEVFSNSPNVVILVYSILFL